MIEKENLKLNGKPSSLKRLPVFLLILSLSACAIFASRPTQEMSDTAAAIRAAYEVQADLLAPELLRQAKEWHSKARHEYRMKNFRDAAVYAKKARQFAEQAEFESMRNGANRMENPPDPLENIQAPPPPEAPAVTAPKEARTPEPLPTTEGLYHEFSNPTPTPEATPTTAPTPTSVPTPPPPFS